MLESKFLQDNMNTMRPTTAMVRVEDYFGLIGDIVGIDKAIDTGRGENGC